MKPDIGRRDFWALCALAFFLIASYHVVLPTSQSLFLAHYTSDLLPQVWLATAMVAPLAAAAVQWLSARVAVLRAFVITGYASCVLLALLLTLYHLQVPGIAFVLYIWRDLYVVLLVELFWTFANAVFAVGPASRLYGYFLAAGSAGGATSFLVMPLAECLGTLGTFWVTLPVLLGVTFGAQIIAPGLNARTGAAAVPGRAPQGGLALLKRSRYLLLMLAMVAIIQGVVTMVDFQFNAVIEHVYPGLDERTGVIGNVTGTISAVAFLLQMVTQPVLRLAGVGGVLVGVPLILAMHLGAFMLSPSFAVTTLLKVASKALDYSVFRAAKEILYIPLSYADKTQGKAFIDMATYRVAKGGAALIIWAIGSSAATLAICGVNLGFCLLWLACSILLARLYRRATATTSDAQPTA